MKNYIYADLSLPGALALDIEGVRYDVSQYTSTGAINEIPMASCLLAIGRDAKTQAAAKVHTQPNKLSMQRAKILFKPTGEYDAFGHDWPDKIPADGVVIFDGFFTGFAYGKMMGKIHVVANLIHWSAALSFSSCLTQAGHVANPTQLNAAAVLQSLGGTGGGEGNNISALVPAKIVAADVGIDLWKGIKNIFCELAVIPTMPTGPDGSCGGAGDMRKNDTAMLALQRIEGPADKCNVAYKWGVPLKMDLLGIQTIADAIAEAIGQETIESWSTTSFWDKLIGQYCPMFGMAFVPMAESAIIIADTPAFNGDVWKTITQDEISGFDMSAEQHRPLRAVGIVSSYDSQTMGDEEYGVDFPQIGGCWVEDSVKPGDGMIQYVAPPSWLRSLRYQPNYAGETSGAGKSRPSNVVGADGKVPAPAGETPDTFGTNANAMYKRYAHDVFVNNMLRGRVGSFSGKLRFDIAPGSIVRIVPDPEMFLGGEDGLAQVLYGCVQRVTIAINSESTMAGTTFQLSHIRTQAENDKSRTSVTEHPLFGKSIHGGGLHGSPMVDIFNIV